MSKLEALVRHNANKLNDSVTNQEKLFLGQGKVLEKISSISSEEQKKSYAEAVKEVGVEVVAQVTKKIEKMPAVTFPIQRSHEEVAGVLDEIED